MRARARGERGAVLMITSVIALGAMVMVGLVVDLGQLRVDRRTNKGVADMAARAGVGRLAFGPWSGVCKAREFLLGNWKTISAFDTGSETWSDGAAVVRPANPCPLVASKPDAVPCAPNNPSTWAKLQATAGQGRFTIEIQSGYALPDPRFANDAALGDTGVADQGSCDNLAVIISEMVKPAFAQAGGAGPSLVRVRSVGRLNSAETLDFVAALQLLELEGCDVLVSGGTNTRVIAQPFGVYPGTIQIDSLGNKCSSNQRIINGQAGGTVAVPRPTILACGATSTYVDCKPGTGARPSRIGVYAKNFANTSSIIGDPSAYGDSVAVASPRTGRKYTDERYLTSIRALDLDAQSVVTGNSGLPPGCLVVLLNSCVGSEGRMWLVLQGADCISLSVFFAVPGRTSAQNIWFNCGTSGDVNVNVPLTLSAANSFIVVRGHLQVSSAFTITDPRKVYVGGRSSGNAIGVDVSGSTSIFNVNAGGASACSGRSGPGHSNRLVVGAGSVKVGSGGGVRLCQTFTYLASGYGKVPASDGIYPGPAASATYTGTIAISSGGTVDLSAPNEITGRLPSVEELKTTNPLEELGLWTEAGGTANGLAGGAASKLTGVFFLPNAKPFDLVGGGSLPIELSAQFVSTTLKVSGGATVNLVPNPEDSIPVRIYTTLLVR